MNAARRSGWLVLAVALLLVVAVLAVKGAAQPLGLGGSGVACQPPGGLTLTYTPTQVYTHSPVLFRSEIITGSLPVTYAWTFGDGSWPLTGTTDAPLLTATHTFTAVRVYTIALTVWNTCTITPAQQAITLAVIPRQAISLQRAFVPLLIRTASPPAHLGYGANIAAADHVISLTAMGFNWAKGFVTWKRGPSYDWTTVDNQLREFVPQVRHVLLRIHGGSPPTSADDLDAFESYALALAAHVSDTWRSQGLETIAYEIWNEPNLDYEWGGPPSAAQYTALLQRGYRGIKGGDPQALVVSAGLATTGGSAADLAFARRFYGATQVVPDLTFLRGMYNQGAKGYFDALGSHPYGGSYPPDTPPDQVTIPIYFRRAEEQRQVMQEYGDDAPIWATEFGWVLATACDLGEHEWMEVSEGDQAAYLAAAYAYADDHWPWMGPMFLFNLDFGTVYWYDECDPVRWYSITYRQNPQDPGNSPVLPRQAFHTLREMPKNSAW